MSDLAWLGRTTLLVGPERLNILQNAHVLVVGLGGVGSFAAEFICRAGVGKMTIVDGDVVDPSNRNRQLPALSTTHGQPKVAIMKERLLAINPDLQLTSIQEFLSPEAAEQILTAGTYDYVMDCIDSITPKLNLLTAAYKKNIKIVSSMGAGGKIDPTLIRIADLYDTRECYLASLVRKRLKKMEVYRGIKAVFSIEKIMDESLMLTDGSNFKKSAYGTISYLPAAFGGACASVVIRDLLDYEITMEKKLKALVQREKQQRKLGK
ncbi:MAG: tRNA threonylcarbamoyladenosine dehydratase [Pseudarcicella sp.]|nr:tRNA threonylcarbamoyladenosine dehydratase [Pseudarcicella sp.]MBP6411162.1 tRNA threonylcarbamoyladenosine dehydratase [Pseudarcicella sp.]